MSAECVKQTRSSKTLRGSLPVQIETSPISVACYSHDQISSSVVFCHIAVIQIEFLAVPTVYIVL